MREYLLLLPLIFIFHDMEEMVGFGWFFRNNPELYKRFPKAMKNYIGFTEMGMAIGVYEELLLFGGAALLAYYFLSKILYAVWFGFFMALAGHFIIHIGHTIYIRKYIPSFITSVICLPVSVMILISGAKCMAFDPVTIAGIMISVLVMTGNFFILHAVMKRINRKINSPDKNYNIVPIPGRF
ncbi:MAG: HXXEE domain-containing protein [Saccharofermentans sp.]|nr:HXXEE domain-containing protein [Saccharofermentans sp.]